MKNKIYINDLKAICEQELPWENLQEKTLMITGATGLIGRCLIDTLMMANHTKGLNTRVVAIARNKERLSEVFQEEIERGSVIALSHDVTENFSERECPEKVDYILHLASNTHPVAYATDPIGTITTNVIGLNNLLQLAKETKIERFLFASSVEIYGENRGDTEAFAEDYCGYIDCNTLRAGYPESKRVGEALCQAYARQANIDVVIPRLSRVYGPTMKVDDTKALSQFIKKAICKEDIVLKSAGTQFYSYTYVADAVSALLYCLLCGKSGEAYNISDAASDIHLKDLAAILAEIAGTKVVFDIPDATEQAGYSKATTAVMDNTKMRQLGWQALTPIREGLKKTVDCCIEIEN